MKSKVLAGVVSISILIVGGCASTPAGKPAPDKAKTASAKVLSANDVITRYRKSIYGGDGTRKHQSTTMKGTVAIEQFNIEGPFVTYSMAPDSNVANIELMGMKVSSGCHKGVCWAQAPGAGTATLSGDAAALQMQQADYNQWEHLSRYYTSLEIVPPAEGQESPNYKIKGVKKNGDTDYYEFSKESGLLVAATIEGETAQGHMQIGMEFKNYKSFEGTMVPTELIQSTPQATLKLTFNEVSFVPLTEDKFAKPQ